MVVTEEFVEFIQLENRMVVFNVLFAKQTEVAAQFSDTDVLKYLEYQFIKIFFKF